MTVPAITPPPPPPPAGPVAVDHPPAAPARRRYDSRRRDRQAQQTRGEILAAAVTLFASRGWAKTTLSGIAAEAGVSIETIYAGFASKKGLLREAMNIAIVGDDEPVEWLHRPHVQAVRELPPDQRLRRIVAITDQMWSGPLPGVWAAMLEAAASDPEIARWCDEQELGRREVARQIWQGLMDTTLDEQQLDAIWVVASVETREKLTRQRGLTTQQWQDWTVDVLQRLTSNPRQPHQQN